ncbi:MAG: FKBP-type peptidyl-prolyl cis-trans isomerase [Woeseiaceae bacterium]|nr:FKBP-type peptidyl-prolyl cis-trans isomerase [Woeseiaceae bacterium]
MRTISLWLLLTAGLAQFGCSKSGNNPETEAAMQDASADVSREVVEATEIMPGLSMRLLQEGSGATAEPGHTAVVHYTGWLYDESAVDNRGNKFDSSLDRGLHFEFPLGAGRVIRGWDEGVAGMKVGEVRELTIAPELAYGNRQVGNLIPPGSTLIFEVELADLRTSDEQSPTP